MIRKIARYVCWIDILVLLSLVMIKLISGGKLLRGSLWPHEIVLLGGIWIASYFVGVFLDVRAIRTSGRQLSTVRPSSVNSEEGRRLVFLLGVSAAGLFCVGLSLLVVSFQRFEIAIFTLFIVGALLLIYAKVCQERDGSAQS